jgi:hypothetical protein
MVYDHELQGLLACDVLARLGREPAPHPVGGQAESRVGRSSALPGGAGQMLGRRPRATARLARRAAPRLRGAGLRERAALHEVIESVTRPRALGAPRPPPPPAPPRRALRWSSPPARPA